ncbi:MAG TPA: hypothetical protein VH592_17500 [Gemmataceae bacterium]|jgi:hypothetical protein
MTFLPAVSSIAAFSHRREEDYEDGTEFFSRDGPGQRQRDEKPAGAQLTAMVELKTLRRPTASKQTSIPDPL